MPSTCFRMSFYMLMILASMVLILASMVLIVDGEKIKDLIIFSTLCCKYGVSILVLLHWVAYLCIECIALIFKISSWKLIVMLAIGTGFSCYVGYTVCCQFMALVRTIGKMFCDMIIATIRNAVFVLIAVLVVVGLAACGIYYCMYCFSKAFTPQLSH
jgi:hypothetical protein